MNILYNNIKKTYFPGLRTKLVIDKEPRPKPRVMAIPACVRNGEVHLKSWAKHYKPDQLKEIIIHELVHAVVSGKRVGTHSKTFSRKIVSVYKKAIPSAYKKALRRQYWLMSVGTIKGGRYVPAVIVNGLAMAKKYKHVI